MKWKAEKYTKILDMSEETCFLHLIPDNKCNFIVLRNFILIQSWS